MFILNPGRTAVWSRWTTRRFSTLQCVSSANRTDNICSPDLRIRACGSAGLFCAAGRPPSPRPEFFLSAAVTSFRRRFIRAADRPPCHRPVYLLCRRPSFSLPVHPCRRPALSPSAAVPSFRRRFIRAAGPAPCHRPEFSPFCCRPSFSPPVHPRRRRYTRVAAGTPASPTGPRANGRCSSSARSSSARSSSARTSSAVPLTRPVPAAGASPPPPAPLPRRRPALFLPKCPVAKCQSAVPRRDPAILLTIWQRSPIGTTFVCFMASPVKELAGKMKTNN